MAGAWQCDLSNLGCEETSEKTGCFMVQGRGSEVAQRERAPSAATYPRTPIPGPKARDTEPSAGKTPP